MRHLLFFFLLASAFGAAAQTPQFSVARDSAGFFLVQDGGTKTPFDTAAVAQNLREKMTTELELRKEADLLERLLQIRKSLAILTEERRVLSEIIEKAKKCEIKN